MITGHTRIFGLVGHPVRHSLSPQMHTTLFRRLGLDAVYVAFDVDPRRMDKVADSIRTLDLVGVNLTVPFKEGILPYLDHLTIAAQEAGAVNVVINVDGYLTGYNTDGAGLLRALEEEHGFVPRGTRCAVLGAGGAGRAVAASLAAGGASMVAMLNRTVSRAESSCAQLASVSESCTLKPGPLTPAGFSGLGELDLVVNCLGGGAEALVEALPVELLPPRAIWCDINYWMNKPPALAACQERGLRTSTGLGMLIHQGALSFELFTGHPVEATEIRRFLG